MAEEVQIAGTPEVGKLRNPLGVIGLAIVTLGIYYLFWYYSVNKEMAAIGQARGTEEAGTDPMKSLLALIPGGFIIVPPYVSLWNATKRLNAVERLTHGQPGMEPVVIFLLLVFLGPVGLYLFQANLNKALQAQSGVASAAAPQPA